MLNTPYFPSNGVAKRFAQLQNAWVGDSGPMLFISFITPIPGSSCFRFNTFRVSHIDDNWQADGHTIITDYGQEINRVVKNRMPRDSKVITRQEVSKLLGSSYNDALEIYNNL
jgi:hypothetical protein